MKQELLPELPETDELEFFLVLGELAMKSFKETSFNQLPQQKVKGASKPILGIGKLQAALPRP